MKFVFVCLFNVKECEAEILYLWETEMFVYTVRWMRFIKVGYFSIFFVIRVQLKKNWKIVGWWGILRQWTTKEVVCLKETMAFKYRLFEPCDSLHFFTTCPNPESKCRKQRQNHRSLSLTIVLYLHPDGKNKNIRKRFKTSWPCRFVNSCEGPDCQNDKNKFVRSVW